MSQWDSMIQSAAQKYNVDPALIASIVQTESGGNPNAYNSEFGATGLGQQIPATAKALGIDPKDPSQSIEGVAKLLDENLTRYGNPEQAVLAYHGGTDQSNWGPKTQDYLRKVSANYGAPQVAKPSADDFASQDFAAAPVQKPPAADDFAAQDFAAPVQPSASTPEPVGAGGLGCNINLTGQCQAVGSFLNVSDGLMFGRGFSAGSPLNSFQSNELTLGVGTTALRIGDAGAPGLRSKIGLNNFRALNNEIDIDISPSARMGITIDGTGAATFALMGVKADGTELPLVSFVWSHPDVSTAQGTLEVRMNGRNTSALSINADGGMSMVEMYSAAAVVGMPSGTLYYDGSGVVRRLP